MKKRLLSILLVLPMVLTFLPLGSLANENGGTCGEKLTWTLDGGVLTVTGNGNMDDFSDGTAPWSGYGNSIETVAVAEGVTGIGANAFSFCGMKSVALPESLKTIGANAFTGCPNIKSISIPDGVEAIGIYAFFGCTELNTASLPSSLTKIPEGLFAECPKLGNVEIPDTVTDIGANAFSKCRAFVLGNLPDGIKSIGDAAFSYCGETEKLVLPKSLESIGKAAFGGTVIDEASFDGTSDKWAEIGGNECGIECGVTFLKHICDFGESWQHDAQRHWQQCSCGEKQNEGFHTGNGETCDVCGAALSGALDSGSIDGDLSWSLSRSGILTISGSGIMPGFSAAANSVPWEQHKNKIQSIVIETGVQNISSNAFHGCTAVEKISVSATVSKIDLSAFDGCTALAAFEVAAENKAFYSADGVLFSADKKLFRCPVGKNGTDCTVPSDTVAIAEGAFKDCAGLESLTVPDSVTSIGRSAFERCTALKRITLSKSITKLESSTFSGCSALTEITLPDGVKALGNNVFSGCTALKKVNIPSEVTVIPVEAFSGCTALESITIPKNVGHIKERAFDGCTALKKIDYLGSDSDWRRVTTETGNDVLNAADKSFTFTAHDHKYTDTVIAPTCTERGCTVHLCSCGDRTEDSYTPPSGHKTQLQNVKAADCITDGYTGDEVCSVCGKTVKSGSIIFALGHDPQPARIKAPTCTESGYTGDLICTRCGDMTQAGKTVEASGHKFFGGECSVCGVKDPEAAPKFDDVKPGSFCFDAVQWAVRNGITNGTGKNTFSPNAVCSRYQIVMFLWRAAGQPKAKANVSFADVKPGDIFYDAVQWAVERGIAKGMSSTSFAPYASCTRGQIVTFLYRSAGSPKVSGTCDFSDVSAGSFCRDAVIWASSEGITKGTSNGIFSPNNGCTRGQVVTFLYRAAGDK